MIIANFLYRIYMLAIKKITITMYYREGRHPWSTLCRNLSNRIRTERFKIKTCSDDSFSDTSSSCSNSSNEDKRSPRAKKMSATNIGMALFLRRGKKKNILNILFPPPKQKKIISIYYFD